MLFRTDLENQLFKSVIRRIAPFIVAGGMALISCSAQPVQTPKTPADQPTTQEQTYNIIGTVYHDYNGNGIKEENEPALLGVELDLISKAWPPKEIRDTYPWKYNTSARGYAYEIQMKTDSNGNYSIQMTEGDYELRVHDNVLGYNDQPFRYISISPAEFQKITDRLKIEVNGDTNYDVALMQGFLTLPFGPDTEFLGKNEFGIQYYADRDNRQNYTRDWKGGAKTYDVFGAQHNGTDFFMEENTPILAAAPGIVIAHSVPYDPTLQYFVAVLHENPYGDYNGGIDTVYGHLNEVNVKAGDRVKRGDVIGLSGKVNNCAELIVGVYDCQHLHFGVILLNSASPYKPAGYTDPYRNIVPLEWSSEGLWTKDNDPQYFMIPPQ